MVEDALDDLGLRDEADDAHGVGACGADEGIDLVDAPQEVGPTIASGPDGGGGRLGLIRALGLGAGLVDNGLLSVALAPGGIGVEAMIADEVLRANGEEEPGTRRGAGSDNRRSVNHYA